MLFIFKTHMAVNQANCLKMVYTSPVKNTEIADDQKYRVKMYICKMSNKRSHSVRKVAILPLFSLMRIIIKTLYHISEIYKEHIVQCMMSWIRWKLCVHQSNPLVYNNRSCTYVRKIVILPIFLDEKFTDKGIAARFSGYLPKWNLITSEAKQ